MLGCDSYPGTPYVLRPLSRVPEDEMIAGQLDLEATEFDNDKKYKAGDGE